MPDRPFDASFDAATHAPILLLADAFADAAETDDSGKDYVHIRIQQRNGKKSLTTIQVCNAVPACMPLCLLNAALSSDYVLVG